MAVTHYNGEMIPSSHSPNNPRVTCLSFKYQQAHNDNGNRTLSKLDVG